MYALALLERIKALDLEEEAKNALQANFELMADLNASQLAQGLRTDGAPILPPYRPLTVQLKRGRPGLAGITSHVTLFDTGEHYRELFARFIGNSGVIEYGSRSRKSAQLEEKYATKRSHIYGLTDESRREVIEGHLKPQFYRALHLKING